MKSPFAFFALLLAGGAALAQAAAPEVAAAASAAVAAAPAPEGQAPQEQANHARRQGVANQIPRRGQHEHANPPAPACEQRQPHGHGQQKQGQRLKAALAAQQAPGQHHPQRLQGNGHAKGQVNLGHQAQHRHDSGKQGNGGQRLGAVARQSGHSKTFL